MPSTDDLPVVAFPRSEFATAQAAAAWLQEAVLGLYGPMADVLHGLTPPHPPNTDTDPETDAAYWDLGTIEYRSTFPTGGVIEVATVDDLLDYATDYADDIAAADTVRPITTADDILGIIDAYGQADPTWAAATHVDSDGRGRWLGPALLTYPGLAWSQAARLNGWITLGREQLATAKKRAHHAKALRTVEDAHEATLEAWRALVWRWVSTARIDAENGPYTVVITDDPTDSPAARRGSNPAGTPRLGY